MSILIKKQKTQIFVAKPAKLPVLRRLKFWKIVIHKSKLWLVNYIHSVVGRLIWKMKYLAFKFYILNWFRLQLPEKEPTHYHIYEDDRPERPPLEDLGLEDLCNNNEDCETTSEYFESKVKPFIDLDTKKNVVPTKSIFDNVATLGKNLKNLKITVSFICLIR